MGGGDGRLTTEAVILRVMAAARLDGTPAVFGVLHAYAENRCPELNERVDGLAKRGEPLTAAVCDELYGRYLAAATSIDRERRRPWEPPLPVLQAEIRRLQDRLAAAEQELGRDHLTGLANRRRLEAILAALVEACRAERRPLSVAVADVDRFKAINDGYGHAVGDGVIRLVAAVLSSRPDAVRLAARLGGDEFVLVLPDVPLGRAQRVVEELRQQLARRRFVARASRRVLGTVSISAGVAELHPDEDASELLRRADAALYAAKRGGRNAVTAAGARGAELRPLLLASQRTLTAGSRPSVPAVVAELVAAAHDGFDRPAATDAPACRRRASVWLCLAAAFSLLGTAAVLELRASPDRQMTEINLHRLPTASGPVDPPEPVTVISQRQEEPIGPADVSAPSGRRQQVCVYRGTAAPSCVGFNRSPDSMGG